jgi:transcriptional regulator with XRE-family HTH domain
VLRAEVSLSVINRVRCQAFRHHHQYDVSTPDQKDNLPMETPFSAISSHTERLDRARNILVQIALHGRHSVSEAERTALARWLTTYPLYRRAPGPGFLDIRARRHQVGLTQLQLAQRVGVHRTSIIRWEQTQRVPTLELAQRLADALDMDHRQAQHLARSYRAGSGALGSARASAAATHVHTDRPLWGANLRAAREAAGMTQAALAEAVGIQRSTLSRYECGHWRPTEWVRFQKKARMALGLTP